jgi:hypothetical protein
MVRQPQVHMEWNHTRMEDIQYHAYHALLEPAGTSLLVVHFIFKGPSMTCRIVPQWVF